MLNHEWLSKRCVWCLVWILAIGCSTRPNPLYCGDGLCSDPAYPFCDVDGIFGETRLTCVAVSCTPGEVAACRGDQAILCNSAGNNYDLVQCERGCEESAGGCRRCEADEQCSSSAPVCDRVTGECRGCADDDECTSRVCDLAGGRCLTEDTIVYASPTGAESGACSQAAPCSTARAVSVARADAQRSLVRLLPGVYANALAIHGAATITVVGTGATIDVGVSPANALDVGDPNNTGVGPNVTIRGLTLAGNPGGCGQNYQQGASRLWLEDVSFKGSAGFERRFDLVACALTMRRVELVQTSLFLIEKASLDAEQVRFISSSLGANGAFSPYDLRVMSSVFAGGSIHLSSNHVAMPSRISFAFNTVVSSSGSALDCRVQGGGLGTGTLIAFVENNILVGANADAVIGTKCTTNHNVLFPQAMAIPGTNIVADPLLADPAAGDLRLRAGSPAIDAAVPSTGLSTDRDLDGTARPQGAAPDIGAYEFKP